MIHLRKAKPDDVTQIIAVLRVVGWAIPILELTPDREKALAGVVLGSLIHKQSWVATEENNVIGIRLCQPDYPTGIELTYGAVLPEHEGQGVYPTLMKKAFDMAIHGGKPLHVTVKADNKSNMLARLPRYGFRIKSVGANGDHHLHWLPAWGIPIDSPVRGKRKT